MTWSPLQKLLLVALAVTAPLVWVRVSSPPQSAAIRQPPSSPRRQGPGPHAASAAALDSLAEVLIERDPFRLSGRAPARASSAVGALSLTDVPVSPAQAQTPILRAVMGGPPWQAIVESGTGGGTVVQEGTAIGPFHVVRIRKDTVVVRAADTSITLTLGRF